ncbi:MAG: hypothetical protein ACXVEF_30490 [Polyangiales bacterium]
MLVVPTHSPSLKEFLGKAFAFDPEELAELDSELAQMDVRDVAGRLLLLRAELSVDSAA